MQDHGYIVSLGTKAEATGFLKKKDANTYLEQRSQKAPKNKGKKRTAGEKGLPVGHTLRCALLSTYSASEKVVKLNADPAHVASAVVLQSAAKKFGIQDLQPGQSSTT